MAKQSAEKQAEKKTEPAETAGPYPWSAKLRGVVSIFLTLHVFAVFVAPWSGPPPASELSFEVSRLGFREYLHAVNINHGYRFFAPEPGRSHLIRYELQRADGSIVNGTFPDLEEQWPRLLYHRHFMVAEMINQMTMAEPPREPRLQFPNFDAFPPAERRRLNNEFIRLGRDYEAARRQAEELLSPVAQRLMIEHDAQVARLWAVEHAIPTPEEVEGGMELTDPRLYRERPLGEFRRQS